MRRHGSLNSSLADTVVKKAKLAGGAPLPTRAQTERTAVEVLFALLPDRPPAYFFAFSASELELWNRAVDLLLRNSSEANQDKERIA
jgi:hypothetical protein